MVVVMVRRQRLGWPRASERCNPRKSFAADVANCNCRHNAWLWFTLPRAYGSQARMMIMANEKMMAQMSGKGGFIAALDQSGGSTPGALRLYGIPDNAYSGDAEMFRLVHEMRARI